MSADFLPTAISTVIVFARAFNESALALRRKDQLRSHLLATKFKSEDAPLARVPLRSRALQSTYIQTSC